MQALPAVGLVAAFLHVPTRAQADSWVGPDKTLHVCASAVIAAGGYAVATPWFSDPPARAAVGATLGLAAGVAKELYDAAGYGEPSYRDLVWDLAGVATGVGVAMLVNYALLSTKDATSTQPACSPLRFCAAF